VNGLFVRDGDNRQQTDNRNGDGEDVAESGCTCYCQDDQDFLGGVSSGGECVGGKDGQSDQPANGLVWSVSGGSGRPINQVRQERGGWYSAVRCITTVVSSSSGDGSDTWLISNDLFGFNLVQFTRVFQYAQ